MKDEINAWMKILDKISNRQDELNKRIKEELPNLKPITNEDLLEEEIQYTCCGDEITGEVEDYGLCPTCKEHI